MIAGKGKGYGLRPPAPGAAAAEADALLRRAAKGKSNRISTRSSAAAGKGGKGAGEPVPTAIQTDESDSVQWMATTDPTSGKTYYYHPVSRETRWSDPNAGSTSNVGKEEKKHHKKKVERDSLPSGVIAATADQLVKGATVFAKRSNGKAIAISPRSALFFFSLAHYALCCR